MQFKDKTPKNVTPIALDARRVSSPSGKPRIVVLVVGETARAANFQLDGYDRQTNPELAAIPGLVSFTNLDRNSVVWEKRFVYIVEFGYRRHHKKKKNNK